jgi:hypothetical protein
MLTGLSGYGAMTRGATPFAAVARGKELLSTGRYGRRSRLCGIIREEFCRSGCVDGNGRKRNSSHYEQEHNGLNQGLRKRRQLHGNTFRVDGYFLEFMMRLFS